MSKTGVVFSSLAACYDTFNWYPWHVTV